jgi:hypothetical protein
MVNSKLAVGLALFISGIAAQLSGMQHGWLDALTPMFVSGMLIQLSGFILSVWGGIETKPYRDINSKTRSSDNEREENDKK